MVEQTGQKSKLSSLNRFEQLALLSSILIWTGVVAFGIGLWVALYNLRTEQVAYAKVAETAIIAPEATVLTPMTQLYPAGWSTATPTPPATSTPTPASTRERAPSPTRIYADVAVRLDGNIRPGDPLRTDALGDANTRVITDTRGTSAAPSPTAQTAASPSAPTETAPLPLYPPDRLVIPAIKLDSPVVPIGWTTVEQDGEVSRVWAVVDQVVGWHKTSAYPGSVGNAVLNGHHNIKGEIFRYLVDVEVGDRVIVYAKEQTYYYAITEKHIVKEKGEPIEVRRENARWIGPTTDERLTMITCWPYTNNTHRLIVVAHPTSPPTLEGLERSQEP